MQPYTLSASLATIRRHQRKAIPARETVRRILSFLSPNDLEEFELIKEMHKAFSAEIPADRMLEAIRVTLEFRAQAEKA